MAVVVALIVLAPSITAHSSPVLSPLVLPRKVSIFNPTRVLKFS